ncbi:helix-turn-helix domain-containing protein [Raoultella planticola]|uniref:helix-turn-helix domain-containing protein n=1 Tax=Raoultella planticola TaxID=575 RepID=UPI000459DEB2|nr:helix-turn-helix transcriptional regulator [Raoultella planticola]KAJ96818.1 regulator [Raoultella planticola]
MKEETQQVSPVVTRLRELMLNKNLTQSDMARIAGVSRSAANRWFTRGSISKDAATAIAQATGVSLQWILTGEELASYDLNEEERALIDTYRAMPPLEQRNMVSAFQMRLQQLKEFYSNYVDPTTRQK